MAQFDMGNVSRFVCTIDGNQLLVVEFKVKERICTPFEAVILLASEEEIALDDALGQDRCSEDHRANR